MSAGLKEEGCYQHVSLLACYLISILIVSCLNNFNNILYSCFPKYTLFLYKKRTAIVLLSFRRRYFTMGIVKIYNVLGGFYSYYSITLVSESVNKHAQIFDYFLCNMYSLIYSLFLTIRTPTSFNQMICTNFPLVSTNHTYRIYIEF